MFYKDIPDTDLEWIKELKHGDPFVEDHVTDLLYIAIDIDEFKKDVTSKMSAIITECAQVIQHANEMETQQTCQNCGDKT